MAHTPLFSIVLPSYNRARFLPRSIQSVLNQSVTDWELLIIDDGSTDDTAEVVASFVDPRITYVYQDNAERSAARNKGIAMSSGSWICFLDSDDEFLPQHLASFQKMIDERAEPRLLCTNMIRNEAGKQTPRVLINDQAADLLDEIWTKFIVPTQSCVHRSILETHRFHPKFRLWEDTHLFIRIAAEYPVQAMEELTCVQHVHAGSSIEQGMHSIKYSDVLLYRNSVLDLLHYPAVMARLSKTVLRDYLDTKYRMYLYSARQNKQTGVALRIWWKALWHRPSLYLLTEFPKIFLNTLGLGIHG